MTGELYSILLELSTEVGGVLLCAEEDDVPNFDPVDAELGYEVEVDEVFAGVRNGALPAVAPRRASFPSSRTPSASFVSFLPDFFVSCVRTSGEAHLSYG